MAPPCEPEEPPSCCESTNAGLPSQRTTVIGFAIASTLIFAFCGWVVGIVAGGLIGVAVGFPLAIFSFGLSIPIAAVVGGSIGGAIGVLVGGSSGFLAGGLFGYAVFKWRAEILAAGAYLLDIVSRSLKSCWVFAASLAVSVHAQLIKHFGWVFVSLKCRAKTAVGKVKRASLMLCDKLHIDPQDPQIQFTAVSAIVAGICFAACSAAAGAVIGGCIGVILGILPAIFTFGLSIIVGAIFLGGLGTAVGACFGGIIGVVVGGVSGYFIYGRFISPGAVPDPKPSAWYDTSAFVRIPETWKIDSSIFRNQEVVATYIQNLLRLHSHVEKSIFQMCATNVEPSLIFTDRGMVDTSAAKLKDDWHVASVNDIVSTDDSDTELRDEYDSDEDDEDRANKQRAKQAAGAEQGQKIRGIAFAGMPIGLPVSAGWDAWNISPRAASSHSDEQDITPR